MLLVKSAGREFMGQWKAEFGRHLPDLEVVWWDDPEADLDRARYVLVWQPVPGWLARIPNLEVIFSSAAGVEHIVSDPQLPRHLPIVRQQSEELAQTVGEYVTLATLMLSRDQPRMAGAQARVAWDYFEPPRAAVDTRVGLLGLGAMGQRAAAMLRGIGFKILGWSRAPRTIDGIACHHGPGGLDTVLAGSHILVSLLPETNETRGLLDGRRLRQLPQGACVINAGRGSAVVLGDLAGALDDSHLAYAMLDVFETEPLPADHPAWRHPRIIVTSHVAGYATVPAKAAYVADCIKRHRRGEPLPHLYDPIRGY